MNQSPVGFLWGSMDLAMLALTVWREARGEGTEGMKAVACSIRNRVRRPSWWGHTFYEVCTKKWQYSSMTAPNDPQLGKFPSRDDHEFEQSLWISNEVVEGRIKSPVPGADSYYDSSIAPPAWAIPAKFVGRIGRLNFYNMDRDVEVDHVA